MNRNFLIHWYYLLKYIIQVVKDEVKIFVCQKVIHPVLQQYLRSQGIIVIERLGISLMEPLIQLTGRLSCHCGPVGRFIIADSCSRDNFRPVEPTKTFFLISRVITLQVKCTIVVIYFM